MKVLAVETSCDETAVAVIDAKADKIRVLANVISSQVKLHAKYGGVVPSLAAREHAKNIGHVFETALQVARCKFQDIDLLAVTRGPGLGPALLVGLTFARTLAFYLKKAIVGVNHMDGHIHSNWLGTKLPKKIFPALNLVVSGGHTELVLMQDHGKYRIIGETLDDAVGEAFDKAARLLGLGYPGGPAISKLAEMGDPNSYPLPRPMLNSKNFDFSYSGLKTAVLYLVRDLGYSHKKIPAQMKANIAASFQEAAVDVLVQKTVRAVKEYETKTLMLSGGVSANKLLRQRLTDAAVELNIPFLKPEMQYTTDNAAMIAVAGYYQYLKSKKKKTDYASVMMDANLTL